MKYTMIKKAITIALLVAPFGVMQISQADADNAQDMAKEPIPDTDAVNSEFSSVISNRVAMTTEIIDRLRDEARKKGLEDWESELTAALNQASNEAFLAAYNAGSNYKAVVSALAGTSFDKIQLTKTYSTGAIPPIFIADSAYKNLVYAPVTPCRILSTKILSGTTRAFHAHGTGAVMSTQGGNPGGCMSNNNKDAFGYVFNITVHHTAAHGHIRIFPAHKTGSVTSIVNFISGAAVANSSVVKTSINYGKDFKIFAARDANVIVDVMGYFDKPAKAMPDTYTVKTSVTLANNTRKDRIITPSCPIGYRLISGGSFSTRWGTNLNSSLANSSGVGVNVNARSWRCDAENNSGASATITCYGYCLRIPGK